MKRVAVLRGGPSDEYDISLKTGAAVLDVLKQSDYPILDVFVTRQGEWLESGFVRNPEKLLEAVDVVFLALHGGYGEDGTVQKILQRKHIPFTGSRSLPSALAFNKHLAKQAALKLGVKVPRTIRITQAEAPVLGSMLQDIIAHVGTEFVVKPERSGSSINTSYIPAPELLLQTIVNLLKQYDAVLVEEFVRGREATVGIISQFRHDDLYVLPVVEIVPPYGLPLFMLEHKLEGKADYYAPGRFSYSEKSTLSDVAKAVHLALGLDHYSRSDFIIRDGDIYFLEINSLPGLSPASLLPTAAASVGLEHQALIRHLIETARV